MLFICGNGNCSLEQWISYYKLGIDTYGFENGQQFILGDFRGVDTLTMEYLKDKTHNVTICHLYNKPRYLPDKFNTYVDEWNIKGGFKSNTERDEYMIRSCTYYLGFDQNSNKKRISGTFKNLQRCSNLGKYRILTK